MNTNAYEVFTVTHEHAQVAIRMAYIFKSSGPETVDAALAFAGCPRKLFDLASELQANKKMG